jgi:hypothetical protein
VTILSDVHGIASESQDMRLSSWTNETYTENDRITSPSTFCEKSLDALQSLQYKPHSSRKAFFQKLSYLDGSPR